MNEMGGACNMCGGQEKCTQGSGGENKGDLLENLAVDRRMLLKLIFKK
jgi:hypothetical protein